MIVKAINTYFANNFYKSQRPISKKISFGASKLDTFECSHIKILKQDMFKNPKMYYENVKEEKCDLNDMFYVALLLRKEESVKPDTQKMQKRTEKYIKKLEKVKKIIKKNPNDFSPSGIRRLSNAINYCQEKIDNYAKIGKDNEKMRVWGKIGRIISEKSNFNPNFISENGESLIEIAINNNDNDMALLLMKNKKFKKPIMFENPTHDIIYDNLERKLNKNIFARIFGF